MLSFASVPFLGFETCFAEVERVANNDARASPTPWPPKLTTSFRLTPTTLLRHSARPAQNAGGHKMQASVLLGSPCGPVEDSKRTLAMTGLLCSASQQISLTIQLIEQGWPFQLYQQSALTLQLLEQLI